MQSFAHANPSNMNVIAGGLEGHGLLTRELGGDGRFKGVC